MKFGILGPLQIHTATGQIRLSAQRELRLLSMLLLSAGRVVPLSQLVDAVWEENPSATAKRQIQNVLSGVRRRLNEAGAGSEILVAESPGYLIRVGPDQLDAQVFEELLSAGRAAGDPVRAAGILREALRLWRGPALSDIAGRAVQAGAARLNELRHNTFEHCIDLELSLGRHRDVVAELTQVAAEQPMRERVIGQLMTALHRSGRHAEALDAYQGLRERLADELGVVPSPQLHQLHTAILRHELPPPAVLDEITVRPAKAALAEITAGPAETTEQAPPHRPRPASISGAEPLDLGRPIAMAARRVATRTSRLAWERREAAGAEQELVLSPRVAEIPALLGSLSVPQRAEVARLLDTLEFENLLVQLFAARITGDQALKAAVSVQLRQCLRLRAVPDIHLSALGTAIAAAMDQACSQALRGMPRLGFWFAAAGPPLSTASLRAMATRNGEILREFASADAVEGKIEGLRRRVAERYQHVRLPHLDLPWVEWDSLYVPPTLVLDRAGTVEIGMLDLIEPGRKSVVLGNPGAGKSTLAIRLASALCRDEGDGRVPFLLVLRDLSGLVSDGRATLKDFLVHSAQVPHDVCFTASELDYVLLNGRAVVFVDGLDELIDLSQRAGVIDQIEAFARTYPLVSIVVTSRHVGYGLPDRTVVASTISAGRTASLDHRIFPAVAIRHFSDAQVAGYANRWFKVARPGEPSGPETSPLAESFLSESRSIPDLRANPLLLSLLCASYARRQHIPRNRAEIYAQCSVMIFNQWDEERGIRMEMRFRGWLRGAVRYLAWQMLEEGGQPEVPRRAVQKLLIRFLQERGLDRDEAGDEAEKFLRFCSGRAWILTEVGTTDFEPVYGFAHRTFLEFYAADYLVANHETVDVIWQILRSKLSSGDWDMISQVVLQLVDQKNEFGANRILQAALEELAAASPTAAGHLGTFAARALGHVRPSPAVTTSIVNASIDDAYRCPVGRHGFGFSDHHVARQQKADEALFTILAESLEEIGGEVTKTVDERLTADLAGGDPPLRHKALALAAGLTHLIRARAFEHASAWDDLASKLAALGSDIPLLPKANSTLPATPSALEPARLELIVAGLGPPALFRSALVLRSVIAPLALRTHPDADAARALCRALVAARLPWLDSQRWQEQNSPSGVGLAVQMLGPEPENAKTDLAHYLILLLPYLETAALLDFSPPSGSAASSFIRARALPSYAPFDTRISLGSRIDAILAGMPEHYATFLRRWAERAISVTGPRAGPGDDGYTTSL